MYSRNYNVPSRPANAGKTKWPQKKFRNTFIGRCLFAASLLISAQAAVIASAEAGSYSLFESGQVRPLAMSPDGTQLFALNTPDNRLEIFNISKDGLTPAGSVVVGMEPVAVAARSNSEVWVVNNVSDSVSIVNVKGGFAQVTKTLLVGDEPMDVVFAGANNSRAFITTAHRGQNSPIDPQPITPSVGRADVWVFDADALATDETLGGTPMNIITLFTDSPRALAVSADGKKVYAAGFKTGNQTTAIYEGTVTANGGVPGATTMVDTNGDGVPEPHMVSNDGTLQPLTSLIVKYNGEHWVDETGKAWDDQVNFSLPDKDVFVIDATANPPVKVADYSGVGTILFNMAVNPVSGKVYVSNTEALNEVRFTGPGTKWSTLNGHFAESRITVLDDNVTPIHLNKHIDYSKCCEPIFNTESAKSLAQPMDMTVSSDGKTLYVTAFGSQKIGVFDTAKLEDNSFEPDTANQVQLSAGGPAGVVLDEANKRLYVLTRFDDGISIVDTDSKTEVAHLAMYNPEPEKIVAGRRYLYDANFTSSHGDSSCALCHVFGDMDQIAWDLGNPDGTTKTNPGPLAIDHNDFGLPVDPDFKAMKGPMTTQSMRGLANHGAEHWRGDQTGANDEPSVQPDGGAFNERLGFGAFNGAFVDLQGRNEKLPASIMDAYTDFALEIMYPPNPYRHLDNSLTPDEQTGHDFFFDPSKIVDTKFHCNGCHIVDRNANAEYGVEKPGFFGTDGKNTFAFEQQFMKVPHLRNLYQKIGMFGMVNNFNFMADDPLTGLDPSWDPTKMDDYMNILYTIFIRNPNPDMGDQIRGFGYTHDGSVDTIYRFHNIFGFLPRPAQFVTPLDPGNGKALDISEEGLKIRRQLEQYMLVFDSNFFPIMGQQVTLTEDNGAAVGPRIDLLMARADLGECDLVAHTKSTNGYLYVGNGDFQTNEAAKAPLSDSKLRSKASKKNTTVTYTCTPPGSGKRIALDRDEDGAFDGDEIKAGTDPADPSSVPL
jgi:sugar lactone lactonase YvrE